MVFEIKQLKVTYVFAGTTLAESLSRHQIKTNLNKNTFNKCGQASLTFFLTEVESNRKVLNPTFPF